MRIGKLTTAALLAASFALSGAAYAGNVPGGTGSTGNKNNNPEAIQGGTTAQMMNKMEGHKSLPWCSSTRTHNCRHHKSM